MRRDMLGLMQTLADHVTFEEAAADDLMEMALRIEDQGGDATIVRACVRMHRAKIVTGRAQLDALAIEYVRRTDAGLP